MRCRVRKNSSRQKGDRLMESRTHSNKATTTPTTMTRLRKLAITMLAAVTVTIGSLSIVTTASALPRECTVVIQAAIDRYEAMGNLAYLAGLYELAYYYWNRADAIAHQNGC